MLWSEVRPGTWQRWAGQNEHFMRFVGDRAHALGLEHMALTTWARFQTTGALTHAVESEQWADILRAAWKHLRFQHPSIAVTPTVSPAAGSDASSPASNPDPNNNTTFEYVVPDESRLAEWVAQSFFVEEDPAVDVNTVVASLRPSPLLTLCWLPSRKEVILHTSHWRTDAKGALQLLNALFENVTKVLSERLSSSLSSSPPAPIPWGEEVSRLVPSLEDALRLPEAVTEEVEKATRVYFDTLRLTTEIAQLPRKGNLTRPPRFPAYVELELSAELTEALEKASRRHGFDVYSAVHAAVAAVNWRKATRETQNHDYASMIRLDLRDHVLSLNEPDVSRRRTTALASGFYSGCYMFSVSRSQSFIQHARAYEHEYKNGTSLEFLSTRRQFAKSLLDGLQNGWRPPAVSSIDVTFVPNAEETVQAEWQVSSGPGGGGGEGGVGGGGGGGGEEGGGSLHVLSIGLGVTTLTPQPMLYYRKFRGRLCMQMWWNRLYHDDDVAEDILESIRDVLIVRLLAGDGD